MSSVYDSDEWAGFVRGIRAEPNGYTRRLIAADWLDDHDQSEHAAFIRETVASQTSWFRQQMDLGVALAAGLFGYTQDARPLTPSDDPASPGFVWRRGFVEEWRGSAGIWLAHGDALYRREPVRRVRLTSLPTVSNGPVITRETDDATRWHQVVGIGAGGQRRRVVSEWSMSRRVSREIGLIRAAQEGFARLAEMTRPANVLAVAWPGVEFELPG